MCFEYDGQCDVYRDAYPRAKKAHRCRECGRTIEPGQVHLKNVQLFEGYWNTTRICMECEEVRKAIARVEEEHGCHGDSAYCPFGDLWDAVHSGGEYYGLVRRENREDGDGYYPGRIVAVSPLVAHMMPDETIDATLMPAAGSPV